MKAQQQAFVDALLGRGPAPDGLRRAAAGLAVYRNNLQVVSAQALGIAFPRLKEALGDEDFASLAWTFWRAHPPESGDLGRWGGALAGFLVERAGEDSGLPDLARLDWALHEAERAADAALDADSLQCLATQSPEAIRLVLRPGVSVIDQSEGAVLVWRLGWKGQSQPLPSAEAAFMRALLAGQSVADALAASEVKGLAGEPDFDFGAWLQAALQNTWLLAARVTPLQTPSP